MTPRPNPTSLRRQREPACRRERSPSSSVPQPCSAMRSRRGATAAAVAGGDVSRSGERRPGSGYRPAARSRSGSGTAPWSCGSWCAGDHRQRELHRKRHGRVPGPGRSSRGEAAGSTPSCSTTSRSEGRPASPERSRGAPPRSGLRSRPWAGRRARRSAASAPTSGPSRSAAGSATPTAPRTSGRRSGSASRIAARGRNGVPASGPARFAERPAVEALRPDEIPLDLRADRAARSRRTRATTASGAGRGARRRRGGGGGPAGRARSP